MEDGVLSYFFGGRGGGGAFCSVCFFKNTLFESSYLLAVMVQCVTEGGNMYLMK